MKLKTPMSVTFETGKLSAIVPETERGHTKPYKVFGIVDGQRILLARFETPKEAVAYMDELTELWTNDKGKTDEGKEAGS